MDNLEQKRTLSSPGKRKLKVKAIKDEESVEASNNVKSEEIEKRKKALKRKLVKSGEKNQKKMKKTIKEDNVQKWQLIVAKKLKDAEQRRNKGYSNRSYAWFKFVRDLLAANNNVVSLKMFKKKACDFYNSENIEDMNQKEFLKYLFVKIGKHPKFNVDTTKSCVSWVQSRAKRESSSDS